MVQGNGLQNRKTSSSNLLVSSKKNPYSNLNNRRINNDSNVNLVRPTKGRYWRTVPLNSSLRNLILDLKQNLNLVNSGFVLPKSKDWSNGDQAVPLKAFLRSIKMKPIKFHALLACFATQMQANGVSAPIVMKINPRRWTSTYGLLVLIPRARLIASTLLQKTFTLGITS